MPSQKALFFLMRDGTSRSYGHFFVHSPQASQFSTLSIEGPTNERAFSALMRLNALSTHMTVLIRMPAGQGWQ